MKSKKMVVLLSGYGLGHYKDFSCLYSKLKERREIEFLHCFTSDSLPAEKREELEKIFGKENIKYSKGIKPGGTWFNLFVQALCLSVLNLFMILRQAYYFRKLRKKHGEVYCLNFEMPGCNLLSSSFEKVYSVYSGMGKYIKQEGRKNSSWLDKISMKYYLKREGIDTSSHIFNVTALKTSSEPENYKGAKYYETTPLIPEDETEWRLPFSTYNLVYYAPYTSEKIKKELFQMIKNNWDENFLIFGDDSLPKEISFNAESAGVVSIGEFIYALKCSNRYIGTMGVDNLVQCNRLNKDAFGIALHPEQLDNLKYLESIIVLDSFIEYPFAKQELLKTGKKNKVGESSSNFIVTKIIED